MSTILLILCQLGQPVPLLPEAAPTPMPEVIRVINLLPKPKVAFVDYGCGADARWCVAAAQQWGCKCIGVELDPARAASSQKRVEELGLEHLIVILLGDATTADVKADVGVAYLYTDTLGKLPLKNLDAFASYIHQPPGLPVLKNGDFWLYTKPAQQPTAVWGDKTFTHPVCDNPNCGMCATIRAQLAKAPKGHTERRKICDGRSCWFVDVWVEDK